MSRVGEHIISSENIRKLIHQSSSNFWHHFHRPEISAARFRTLGAGPRIHIQCLFAVGLSLNNKRINQLSFCFLRESDVVSITNIGGTNSHVSYFARVWPSCPTRWLDECIQWGKGRQKFLFFINNKYEKHVILCLISCQTMKLDLSLSKDVL